MALFERILRYAFFLVVVRPLVLVVLGLNVRRRERLVFDSAGVVVANHNSHLDVFVLMTLFPLRDLHRLRPVAARDYFFKTRLRAWFSRAIVGIIPIDRDLSGVHTDPLEGIDEALERAEVVILFPEGTRGEPERMSKLRTGVAHVAKRHPDVPFVPVLMHGLGKAMPRGEALLVPFIVDVFVGAPMRWEGDRKVFMEALGAQMDAMIAECPNAEWS